MGHKFHREFTAAEKTELWDRWKESLKAIGRAFDFLLSACPVLRFAVVPTMRSSNEAATRRLVICSRMTGPAPCCSKTTVRIRFSEPREFLLTVQSDSRSVRAGARDSRDGNQHSREIGGVPCVKNSLLTVSSVLPLRVLSCFALACSHSHFPNLCLRPAHLSSGALQLSKVSVGILILSFSIIPVRSFRCRSLRLARR